MVPANRNPLSFSVWRTRSRNGELFQTFGEKELVETFAWRAFLRRVDQLPAGESLHVFDSMQEDSAGVATNAIYPQESSNKYRFEVGFVSGFRMGIYMILAERLSGGRLRYASSTLASSNASLNDLPAMRYRDKRLSWRGLRRHINADLLLSFKYKLNSKLYER